MNPNDKEKLDVLDGSRSANTEARRRQAVRVADLAPALEFIDRLQSAPAAGATPTKAEFDALQSDIRNLHLRLKQISENLSKKLR
ncbi:hypothetical protein [Oricola sp.]|uniref:hypothetical protein n=1 Tax=Oricola sp. TaxID=1979950 RepID=UPI003BACE8CF